MRRFWISIVLIVVLCFSVVFAARAELGREAAAAASPEEAVAEEDPDVYVTGRNRVRLLSFDLRPKENPSLSFTVTGTVDGYSITLFVPPSLDVTQCVPYFTTSGEAVYLGGVEQISGQSVVDLTQPVTFDVYRDGVKKGMTQVRAYRVDTGLPIISIQTEDEAKIVKDVNVACTFMLYDSGMTDLQNIDLYSNIHYRGNSSSDMPKKSYTLTLGSKNELLGMEGRSKKWLLIANYCDKTLMRNYLAYTVGGMLDGLSYTPECRYVELLVNGEYLGNYLLCEKVQVADGRQEFLSETDEANLNFMLEAENRDEMNSSMFTSAHGLRFVIREPEPFDMMQKMKIYSAVNQLEYKIFNFKEENYLDIVDLPSFADWGILNELFKNVDATFYLSTFLYRDGGVWHMGAPWDFDISAGNGDYFDSTPIGYWNTNPDSKYYNYVSAVLSHREGRAHLKARYKELRPLLHAMPERVEETRQHIAESARLNFIRWPILNEYVWPNAVVLGSWEKEVKYLSDWFEQRVDWLDQQWNR